MSSGLEPRLTFWCHNVGKSSLSYTSLLAQWGEDGPDIVLIQEPPWIQVGLARSLDSPEGDKIFGLPTLRGFHVFYPDSSTWSASSPTERPRAILLVHKRWTSLSIKYRQDLSPTRDICSVILTIEWTDGAHCPLLITSVYNGAPLETNLAECRLRDFDIPPGQHWLVAGDFNRHHPDWSAHRAPSASLGAAAPLRAAIAQQGLTVLNDSDVVT